MPDISNKEEFEENLKKLSDLYEEGKRLTTKLLPIQATKEDMKTWDDLRDILKQMRDLTATQMQHKHWLNEN